MTTGSTKRKNRDQQLFDRISLDYARKDQYLPAKIARKIRLLQTFKTIPDLSSLNVLEVGCGAGYSASYLKGLFGTFKGIDYSQELIFYANEFNKSANVTFEYIDFYSVSQKKQYDVIVMIGVLHHMENIPAAVTHAYNLLKPGGYLIANEPQSSNLFLQLLRKVRGIIDSSYSSEQVQLSEKELMETFQQSKFIETRVFSQGFFSTPFAEVMLKPQWLFLPLSHFACTLDRLIESGLLGRLFKKLAWNIAIVGRKL